MYSGKILVAKEKNTVTAVKVNVSPTSRQRLTQERTVIPAGAVVMCVYEYVPESSLKNREKGMPTTPYLFVLYEDKTWEATPHTYGIVEPSDVLKGKSICFTGEDTTTKGTREYWKAVVEAYGGSYSSAVTSSTAYLVMGNIPGPTTKARKAKEKGVPCISYTEFEKMLTGS